MEGTNGGGNEGQGGMPSQNVEKVNQAGIPTPNTSEKLLQDILIELQKKNESPQSQEGPRKKSRGRNDNQLYSEEDNKVMESFLSEISQTEELDAELSKEIGRKPLMKYKKFSNYDEKKTFIDKLYSISQNEEAVKGELKRILGEDKDGEIEEIMYLAKKSEANRHASRASGLGSIQSELGLKDDEARMFSVEGLKAHKTADGNLSDEGKVSLKNTALKALNSLLRKVDANPDREFDKGFNEFTDGATFKRLQDVILNMMDSPDLKREFGEVNAVEISDFIQRGVLQELSRERELRELYHNVPLILKTIPPDKIAGFVGRYDASLMTAPISNDSGGGLVSMAMSLYESFLAYDIALNKNELRPSLFASAQNKESLIFENEDRERLKGRFERMIKNLTPEERKKKGIGKEVEGWEMERALKYAKGMSMLVTMRGFEVCASANAPEHFMGSADNIYNMISMFVAKWKWKLGRGGFGSSHTPEIFQMKIDKEPKENFFKRMFKPSEWKDLWNPKKFHDDVRKLSEERMKVASETLATKWLRNNLEFKKMLGKFGIGSLATRMGWRAEGIKDEFKYDKVLNFTDAIDKAIQEIRPGMKLKENWDQTYEVLTKHIGAGARFFFDGDRAKEYLDKHVVRDHLGFSVEQWAAKSKAEQHQLTAKFQTGEKFANKILNVDGKDYSYMDLLEMKTLVLRGENFAHLMQRSPLAFLNNITQIMPELLPSNFGGDKVGDRDIFEWLEVDENSDAFKNLKIDDRIKIVDFKVKAIEYFGRDNFAELTKINSFYKSAWDLIYKEKGFDWNDPKMTKEQKDKQKQIIIEEFHDRLSFPTNRVKFRNGLMIEKSDMGEDRGFEKLLFDDREGLLSYFKEKYLANKEMVGKNFGNDESLGKDTFFFRVARSWYTEMGHNIHPNTSDMDWELVLSKLGKEAGENTCQRLWGDLATHNEVITGLMSLDELLQSAGQSKSLEKIEELHGKIHSLQGMLGIGAMQELQYNLSTIVVKYFQENSYSKIPFPFGTIASFLLGRDVSLSKIYGTKTAMSWNSDDANVYLRKRMLARDLAEDGPNSYKMATRALGVDYEKMVSTEVVPNVLSALFMYLLWKAISDGLKEFDNKKER